MLRPGTGASAHDAEPLFVSARTTLFLVVASFISLVPCHAEEPSYHLGLRLSTLLAADAGDRFDAVYSGSWGEFGLDFEVRWHHAFLEVGGSLAQVDGRDLITVFEPPARTDSRLELRPLRLTAGWIARPGQRWSLYLGGGPTAFNWREVNDLQEREETAFGGHLLAGLQRVSDSWTFRSALSYSAIPDAVEDREGGIQAIRTEDLGLVGIELSARRGIWPVTAPDHDVGSKGLSFRLCGSAVIPTHDSGRVNSVRTLESEADPTAGFGLGASFPLSGPLRLSLDVIYARPDLDGRLVFFNVGTTFRSQGTIDMWGGLVGLDIRIVQRGRLSLYLTPLLAHLDYKGETEGEYSSIIDRSGTNAGLGIVAEVGRGRWAVHAAGRHLAIARIEGFPSGFELEPVVLDLGVVFRPGRREGS